MDSEASRTMEMAALGRPFSLGMLYDCRNDSLVPGLTLWDRNDLKEHIGERQQTYNDFEILASESIDDKSSALNVEPSLKASFLGGLVEVEGSAKYLNDHKTSKNQARVTLKYKTTTKFKQLSMDHLARDHMKHPEVFDKGLATHVVTGILYGAQAFFVFDRDMSENEDHQDIEGNLKVMIQKIPCITIEGDGSLKLEDKDKANVEKFSFRFHGDFCLDKNPVSFQDAVQVYQSLPNLLGADREKAVPMKVWLLPLTSLDSSAAKLVRQISIRLVQESQSVLEDFSELEMRCNDALRTTTVQQFPQIGKKIKTVKQMCSEFKLEFQRNLAKKLPSIRGGGEEEAVLAEILKKTKSSLFNSKDLNEWMDCKEREINILMSFTNMMKNTKIVPSRNDLYKESVGAEHAVCFVFTSVGSAEPYLSALSNYLKQTPKPEDLQDDAHTHDVEKEQWHLSKEIVDTMRNKAKLFRDFAEANKENENIKFLTVGLTKETQKGSSIYLYKDGFSVSENFEPPSKPETVTVSDIKHNSVTLKISPPRVGGENITSYSVEFCVSGEDGWQQKTAPRTEEVTVSDLSPNTEYLFRCRAVTSVGVGPAAEVSGSTKTKSKTRAGFLEYSRELTLDPNTANIHLLLSEGNREATLMSQQQSYSSHPDRFTKCCQVLSRESLTGRCYWEVELRGVGVFVAVAYKNISRTGSSNECVFGFNDKSWALQCDTDSYIFWYNKVQTPVSGPRSSRVGVYLDHRAGVLFFYSVSETMTLLHRVQTTFTQPLYAGLVFYYSSPGDTAEFC